MKSSVQKMKEALETVYNLLMLRGNGNTHCILTLDEFNNTVKMCRSALSEPLRNCDVGTPEEQQERFKDFCRREDGGTCLCCPAASFEDCVLGWAQLPYESEGTNEK